MKLYKKLKNMPNKELLKNFREQIDTLDAEILYLLFRRFTIVWEIWKIKKQENITPLQKDRWKQVLDEKIEIWAEFWLQKEFVVDIWNRIHKEALDI